MQNMIEEKRLCAYIKGLTCSNRERLSPAGIILLRQLAESDPEELIRKTSVHKETLKVVIE
ncbi:MAG: hypothetical protein QXP20_06615, partial [Candidatus Bathyarchaeia archaeon]